MKRTAGPEAQTSLLTVSVGAMWRQRWGEKRGLLVPTSLISSQPSLTTRTSVTSLSRSPTVPCPHSDGSLFHRDLARPPPPDVSCGRAGAQPEGHGGGSVTGVDRLDLVLEETHHYQQEVP